MFKMPLKRAAWSSTGFIEYPLRKSVQENIPESMFTASTERICLEHNCTTLFNKKQIPQKRPLSYNSTVRYSICKERDHSNAKTCYARQQQIVSTTIKAIDSSL